ncbi:unnamed protein product [Protopolystoma xenopodis]|uniref:Uncharacterized protein n=1 Tax=Protopolystoma xenopodis TaxID=117903 RepID=A0A3S4ZVD7_9PLAT|nr:unnamed protein product [Protopolystoma xenopodis]
MVPQTNDFVGLDTRSQARQALENIKQILGSAGLSLHHVVKVSIFLTNIDELEGVNEIYAEESSSDA